MSIDVNNTLRAVPVVPLVQADDPAVAVEISKALAAGGLTVAEVVFRTDRALACLQAVARDVPEMVAGDYEQITALAKDAVAIARRARGV